MVNDFLSITTSSRRENGYIFQKTMFYGWQNYAVSFKMLAMLACFSQRSLLNILPTSLESLVFIFYLNGVRAH